MSGFPQPTDPELNEFGEREEDLRQSVTCISPSTKTDFDIKIVVIGDKGVGKTTFISQYYHNLATPPDGMLTVNRKVVDVVNRKQRCTVAVTTYDDTHAERVASPSSSSAHSRAMNAEHCKALFSDAHGVFIMFDVTERQSFVDLQQHLLQMAEWGNDDAMVFFLANRSDVDTAAAAADGAAAAAAGTSTSTSTSEAVPAPAQTSRFGGEVSALSAQQTITRGKSRVVTTDEADAFAETYGGFMLNTSALSGEGVSNAYEAILYAVTTILAAPAPEVSETAGNPSGSGAPAAAGRPRPRALSCKLAKKSKYLQSWNDRFFTLKDGLLYFQRVEGEESARNTLFMDENTRFTKIGDLQIEVLAPIARKDMLLRFASTASRDEWFVALGQHGAYGSQIQQKEKYDNNKC